MKAVPAMANQAQT